MRVRNYFSDAYLALKCGFDVGNGLNCANVSYDKSLWNKYYKYETLNSNFNLREHL